MVGVGSAPLSSILRPSSRPFGWIRQTSIQYKNAIKPITSRTDNLFHTFGAVWCFGTTFHEWAPRQDTRGQDLIEYALMAGFVAVAAGAVMSGVA
jgi:hypothetical protein